MTEPDNSGYEYTNRDLLEEPESYEYSEFHGVSFLRAYESDRTEAVTSIEQRTPTSEPPASWEPILDALSHSSEQNGVGSLEPLASDCSLPPVTATRIDTKSVLSTLVSLDTETKLQTAWLDRFTKRFEITKQLYTAYDADMQPVDHEPAPLDCYALLSLAALRSYNRNGNLKYLNVVLKLNDLLVSNCDDLSDENELSLVQLVLREELSVLRRLAAEKGVTYE